MHQIETLSNGLTVITDVQKEADYAVVLLAIAAGSRYERKENKGISHFLEHMAFKGSKKFPSSEIISRLIEENGGVSNAHTAKEYITYWIWMPNRHIELASDILSSMIAEPLLIEEEIKKERGVVIEEYRMRKDDPIKLLYSHYYRLQFGNHPLGWEITGKVKTLKSFNSSDFIAYMNSLFSPFNMAVVFLGGLPKNIDNIAQKFFSNLPSRSHYPFEPFNHKKQYKPKINLVERDTQQVYINLGVEGYDRFNEKKYAERVLDAILGTGSSSRLFLGVRDKNGLVYDIDANHKTFADTGFFSVSAGLNREKALKGMKLIKEEIDRITNEKVKEDELAKTREMTRGFLMREKLQPVKIADNYGTDFVVGIPIETFNHWQEKVDSVTREDVLNVAQELFKPKKFNLQIVGPVKDPEPYFKILSA